MKWSARASAVRCLRLVVPVLVTGQMACSFGRYPPTVVAGRPFDEQNVSRVSSGLMAQDVRRLLGEPLEVSRAPNGERWRYHVMSTTRESVRLLNIIPMPDRRHRSSREVIVEFVDAKVVAVKDSTTTP